MRLLFFNMCLAACILAVSAVSHAKDTFSVPLYYDTIRLDPADLLDTDSVWIATQIYDGLFELKPDGDIAPRLLASWRAGRDGRTYSLTLREGVRFSDGSALTTKDIAYTLKRLLKISKRERALLSLIEDINVVDDRRIDVAFKVPVHNFPRILTNPAYYILPSKYAPSIEKGSFFERPLGSGPYRVERWVHKKELVLVRNPYYWAGRPQLREINFVFYDPKKPWTKEELYRFDMLLALPAYSKRIPDRFASRWYHRPTVEFMGFNLRNAFWADVANRRAFARLFGRKGYYNTLFRHRSKSWRRSDSIIPRGLPSLKEGSSDVQKVDPKVYARVRGYLKERVDDIYFASHQHLSKGRLESALAHSLGSYLGRNARAVLVSPEGMLEKLEAGKADFFFMRLVADTFDPYEVIVYFSDDAPHNFSGYSDAAFTKELRGVRMMPDGEEKASAYARLARRLSDDGIIVPIASMFNERLLIRSGCEMQEFGPLGPWYYRMDRIVCK